MIKSILCALFGHVGKPKRGRVYFWCDRCDRIVR